MQAASKPKLIHLSFGPCSGCFRQTEAALSSIRGRLKGGTLIVSGLPSQMHVETIREAWGSLPEPKVVVAIGTCACGGGVFRGCYAFRDLSEIMPVRVRLPGCPPPEEAVLKAIMGEAASATVEGYRGAPALDESLCVACGLCVRVCPSGALEGEEGEKPKLDQLACISCSRCEAICPRGAFKASSTFTVLLT